MSCAVKPGSVSKISVGPGNLLADHGPLVEPTSRFHDQRVRAEEEVLVDDSVEAVERTLALEELPVHLLPEEEVVDLLFHLRAERGQEDLLRHEPSAEQRLDRRHGVARVLAAQRIEEFARQIVTTNHRLEQTIEEDVFVVIEGHAPGGRSTEPARTPSRESRGCQPSGCGRASGRRPPARHSPGRPLSAMDLLPSPKSAASRAGRPG